MIKGEDGNDLMEGGSGFDTIYGGKGNDSMQGEGDNDLLVGDCGDDRIEGNSGNDSLEGGSGDDHLAGHDGNDLLVGGKDSGRLHWALDPVQDFTVDYTGLRQGGNVKVTASQAFQANGFANGNYWAGEFEVQRDGSPVTAFCVELNQSLLTSATPYDDGMPALVAGTNGSEKANLIEQLFGILSPSCDGPEVSFYVSPGSQNLVNVNIGINSNLNLPDWQAQATQLLLWEIIHEYDGTAGSISLTSGGLKFSNLKAGAANEFNRLKSELNFTPDEADLIVANGDFSAFRVGDNIYGDAGADTFVFNKGDGVDLLWDFKPSEGDTLVVNGYSGPAKITKVDGYRTAIMFGENDGVILNDYYPASTTGDATPGVVFA